MNSSFLLIFSCLGLAALAVKSTPFVASSASLANTLPEDLDEPPNLIESLIEEPGDTVVLAPDGGISYVKTAQATLDVVAEDTGAQDAETTDLVGNSSPERLARYRRLHPDAAWCDLCKGVKLSARTHKSKAKFKATHKLRSCKDEELLAYCDKKYENQLGTQSQAVKDGSKKRVSAAISQAEISSSSDYFFELGKYSKPKPKSLQWVLDNEREYLDWCIKSKVHHQYPRLLKALQERGMEGIVEGIPKRVKALTYFAMREEAKTMIDDKLDIALVPPPPKAEHVRPSRKERSLTIVQPHSCLQCGSKDHVTSKNCDVENIEQLTNSLVSTAYKKAGQEAREEASQKYSKPKQRTAEYTTRPKQLSRVPIKRSYLALVRAPPLILGKWLIEDGLLEPLAGKPCEKPRCNGENSKLGMLVGQRALDIGCETMVQDIGVRTVRYRCRECRREYAITHGHPLFRGIGHGSYSASYLVFAWYSFMQGKTVTQVVAELDVSEGMVTRWFVMARIVLSDDAISRQEKIVFGETGSFTVDCEADEVCFSSYNVFPTDGDEDGKPEYYFYVWLGICQGGDLTKLWMKPVCQREDLPLGTTKSTGEKVVPKLANSVWRKYAEEAFTEKSNVVLMSDGCSAYAQEVTGVVQHWAVIHEQKEFCRSVSRLKDVNGHVSEAGMAGTMCIDRAWRSIREWAPRKHISCRSAEARDRAARRIRTGQWMRMMSNCDRWQEFCKAVRCWTNAHSSGDAVALADTDVQGEEHESEKQQDADEDQDGQESEQALAMLGGTPPPLEDVPALTEMLINGLLPITTAAERSQNKQLPHEQCRVPPGFDRALALGYIAPKLPAPQHMHWLRISDNEYSLEDAIRCIDCGKRGDHVSKEDPLCEYHARSPENHPDAAPGDHEPHFRQVAVEFPDAERVRIGGKPFRRGKATGAGNNCLIDTISQLLGVPVNHHNIRARLRESFPVGRQKVTTRNFLTLDFHWSFIIDHISLEQGLELRAANYRIVCVDSNNQENGDSLGEGHNVLHCLREHGNHFIPLFAV